jgi:hypothetical protein
MPSLPALSLLDGLRRIPSPYPAPFADGLWYETDKTGAGLAAQFQVGTLAETAYLSFDVLVEGANSVVFTLHLQQGGNGPDFKFTYFFLNGVGARVRVPLSATDQNRWLYDREGAWLKPMANGDRVDPAKVDRLRIVVERKSAETARFCHTPVRLHAAEPALLNSPPLPHGPIIDAFGQSATRDWPAKVRDEAQLVSALRRQRRDSAAAVWPQAWTDWGGCRDLAFAATGFFRVESTAERFWLVAPDGAAFWSAGIDCWRARNFATPTRGMDGAFAWLPPRDGPSAAAWGEQRSADPEPKPSVCFHTANLVRAVGGEWSHAWEEMACAALRHVGFNTVANWSDWQTASRRRIPYVRPLNAVHRPHAPRIFRDFPDVFDPRYEDDVADTARQLAETKDDPALIGYFLGNEPTWGFAAQTPAEGMLTATEECRTREAFEEWLAAKYGACAALSTAWNMPTADLTRIRKGRWTESFTAAARDDLAAFSTVMVARLYDALSNACKAVDPNHLNLGARYYTVPPAWALGGMTSFDVFSINCYRQEVPADLGERIVRQTGRPVMVGEWHFGALDVGLPSSGIGHVPTQADRGKAYRRYVEQAAALPWCVGVHYFTFYDQSAAGRFDGENYNIGFFDVANQPYGPLVDAARTAHERLYDVARGRLAPFNDPPTYLPLLFC